ncbi:sodium/proton antiporter NhaB [Temperatibacter marinus]|uniref:Sodium/proton antiporter NhaB n=1 Tax=Temperatibacter marinus TaxID=1456591 RepID=A0AA52EAV0_9PROT|nr:sodium/proton antiporter NhaB [Temperatibacter marinus]WND01922.1 sodium/proton antiporter NhaB [Temperatibacter marinus]
MSSRITNNPYWQNFMGHSANWYKLTILAFLIINPILFSIDPYVAGWVLVLEFIFCLAMALKCYPLLPGGLLAFEAIALGMTSIKTLEHEIVGNLEVILLLVFMVAGIYFMQKLILFLFTKMLVNIRNKVALSLLFSFAAAFLSAFLDALTVTAVIITVAIGFYSIYHKVASGKHFTHDHDHKNDGSVESLNRDDLEQFRSFLRSLMMHAAVGTALGGVCTIVGEPQNIVIGTKAGWDFIEFFMRMAPVTLPVLVSGLITCALLEMSGKFGYGGKIPEKVMNVIADYDQYEDERRTPKDKASLVMQGVVGVWLIIGLLTHMAPVGIIGLSIIVLGTVLTGITEEHQIGHAFEEALPFTALLVVFFAIVGVIADQGLFAPITEFVLSQEGSTQVTFLYAANGILSAISDNVFVATVYINQMVEAAATGRIDRETFDMLAVAINTGTNIPSVATPNGQAAFLFLLTSAVAPLIRLSYMKMVVMALPYTIVMSIVGYIMVANYLQPATDWMYENNMIQHHEGLPGQGNSGGDH